MTKDMIERIKLESIYIRATKETVREIATVFNVSKSTVHKDLHERLAEVNFSEFLEVASILNEHIVVRHLRGGEATKRKYLNKCLK